MIIIVNVIGITLCLGIIGAAIYFMLRCPEENTKNYEIQNFQRTIPDRNYIGLYDYKYRNWAKAMTSTCMFTTYQAEYGPLEKKREDNDINEEYLFN